MNGKEDFEILGVDFECPACKKVQSGTSRIPVSRIIEKLDGFFQTNDLVGAERLLDYWQGEAQSIGDLSGELSVVNEMLGLTRKMSKKERGERAVARALELIELTNAGELVSAATILLNAATTCNAFGNPERAMQLYKRTKDIYEKENLPDDDLNFAAFYNNAATTLVVLARYDEAENYYKKAIDITKKHEAILDTAVTYVNMAHLYEAWEGSESGKIEKSLQMAEELLNDARVERNAYYAFVCEKCAPSFDYYGYFFFARELLERRRSIYEGT